MTSNQTATIFKNFIVRTIFLSLALFVAHGILFISIPGKYIANATPGIIIFFLVFTISVFYFQIKMSLKKTSKLINFFMISTALKLLLFLVIVISYSLLNKADAVNFIISFFINYCAFSILEVYQLLKLQSILNPKKS